MDEKPLPVTLLIGGDVPTHAMLRFLLESDGYTVYETAEPGSGLVLPRNAEVSLLVVVAGERESDVLTLLGHVRHAWPRTPMILLSRDVSLSLRRGSFARGVQDIVPLPVAPHDLQTRLRAVLGPRAPFASAPPAGGETVRAGGLLLNTSTREVSASDGWGERLTRREAALLASLMAEPGRVVDHQSLVERVWGADDRGGANALAVYVRRLRAKLKRCEGEREDGQGYVHTAHGRGYVFDARAMPRTDARRTEGRQEVLLVDDDHATLDMMTEVLHMAGYTVTCGVGPQAPTLARQILPAVILLDINMPGMNGIEVRQHLRESPRTATIPVIALSAGGNLRLRAKEMGADDYLAKPFSTDELLLRVEKWAGHPDQA